jgi:hypothetical protein
LVTIGDLFEGIQRFFPVIKSYIYDIRNLLLPVLRETIVEEAACSQDEK